MDISAANAKGVGEALTQAQISFDRFHVIVLANDVARVRPMLDA